MSPFRRGALLALRLHAGKSITTAWIRGEFNVSVATAKRDRAAVLEFAQMSLLDTLTPGAPPTPKGARVVRPLDDPRDDIEVPDMSNKSKSVLALLRQHEDGLGYDDLSRYTGIARDKIASFVAVLITASEVKAYEFPDRGRIFKAVVDPKRAGPRKETPATRVAIPSIAASGAKESLDQREHQSDRKSVEPGSRGGARRDDDSSSRPDHRHGEERSSNRGPVDEAAGSAVSPAVPAVAEQKQPVSEPARAAVSEAAPKPAAQPPVAPPPQPKVSTRPVPLYDLSTELAIIAAANLAAAVRDCKIDGIPELVRALWNFDRADKAREDAKAGAA